MRFPQSATRRIISALCSLSASLTKANLIKEQLVLSWRFGPVPLSYNEIADEERLGILTRLIDFVNETQVQLPFLMAEDEELAKEDRDFIMKMMELDPRDRPTATELLQDEWFAL